jgi:hypothetical protein
MIINYLIDNEQYESILKATFLIVLSVAGNFLAETLGCQTQTLLNNMYAKHILIFFVIYFTIDFTQGDTVDNPFMNIGKALIVWILFHLFTHMDIQPTILAVSLFMILFFISNYRHYIKSNLKFLSNSEKKITLQIDKNLELAQTMVFLSTLVVIIIGFGIYYIEKRREYNKHFSILKFIFGNPTCKHYTPKKGKII